MSGGHSQRALVPIACSGLRVPDSSQDGISVVPAACFRDLLSEQGVSVTCSRGSATKLWGGFHGKTSHFRHDRDLDCMLQSSE